MTASTRVGADRPPAQASARASARADARDPGRSSASVWRAASAPCGNCGTPRRSHPPASAHAAMNHPTGRPRRHRRTTSGPSTRHPNRRATRSHRDPAAGRGRPVVPDRTHHPGQCPRRRCAIRHGRCDPDRRRPDLSRPRTHRRSRGRGYRRRCAAAATATATTGHHPTRRQRDRNPHPIRPRARPGCGRSANPADRGPGHRGRSTHRRGARPQTCGATPAHRRTRKPQTRRGPQPSPTGRGSGTRPA